LPAQASPASQVRALPRAQHVWPTPPQASHCRTPPPIAAAQIEFAASQVVLLQQTWPMSPHAWHVRAAPAPAHSVPAAVHAAPQHAWPRPPQISQLVPPSATTQPVPAAVQMPAAAPTAPPAPPAAQQACPTSPQASQVPATQLLDVQFLPAQQASPTTPQFMHCVEGWQRPARQQSPPPHTLPAQHA
jgi:hypothetical protein